MPKSQCPGFLLVKTPRACPLQTHTLTHLHTSPCSTGQEWDACQPVASLTVKLSLLFSTLLLKHTRTHSPFNSSLGFKLFFRCCQKCSKWLTIHLVLCNETEYMDINLRCFCHFSVCFWHQSFLCLIWWTGRNVKVITYIVELFPSMSRLSAAVKYDSTAWSENRCSWAL